MEDSKYCVSCDGGIAKIQLIGRLDATNAPALQEELKKLIGQKISDLVFLASELEYISSAGLRVIIFAKQKIGSGAQVYFIGAQEGVLSIVKMSGLDTFMTMQDKFDK